ncbi:hypothetical protein [Hymenobacter canadensis]|uniref:Uncharacterized protein n=1 Tax=Hymenobacter canadensis TaxID=2999067 RepID=A0ABY7LUL5_9BACT|nr:hypothetical protein [Hymenobacter canadensis]WBA44089.1 hypothetical protein O3303_19560 [Hymenobacter canadensis]
MTSQTQLELSLGPAGRHLAFNRDLADRAHLFRRVGGKAGTWTRLAANARSPYLDAEGFATDTPVEYYVQLTTRFGDEEARSRIVATVAPPSAQHKTPVF